MPPQSGGYFNMTPSPVEPGSDEQPPWSIKDSATLYAIDKWGTDYFSINAAGNVQVHPSGDPDVAVDLKQLVDQLRQRELELPLLIRFTDILGHRMGRLHAAFDTAIAELDYRGSYVCVYPLKVNQQRHIVEEILRFGRQHGFGLEAGSKPELLAVLAMVDDDRTPIVCNGFKDSPFVEAVMVAAKLGRHVLPVVEKFSELPLLVAHARSYDVRPKIGLRVKLASRGMGHWQQSSGAGSKFGLSIGEVLEAIAYLQAHDMDDCLQMLHVHMGSQINDIRQIKAGLTEIARVYVDLKRSFPNLKYLDVGGGLGVDYDGSNVTSDSSINYSLQEYANDVVFHIGATCDEAKVEHPTILTESGRALVAHHSVLICNVLGSSGADSQVFPDRLDDAQSKDLPTPVLTLFDTFHEITDASFVECYHDALQARDEVLHLFNLGYCTLEQRALAEKMFLGICAKVHQIVRTGGTLPAEFAPLEPLLADTYYCNFSIFQSMPDSWAIGQLFPIMPIHRLEEEPTRQAILGDVTCDSDGKMDRFIAANEARPVLPLHQLNGEDYLLATFLIGAYQETLGDLHNLFGDTNAVHVSLDDRGQAVIDDVIEGDTLREVLQYVQYSPEEMVRRMRQQVERAVRSGRLDIPQSHRLLRFYEASLQGYTYLR
jgi:arginine decarboxylase